MAIQKINQNYISNERISQGKKLAEQGSPIKGLCYRALGNMESIPLMGKAICALDKKCDPTLQSKERAWTLSKSSPDKAQLEQVEKIVASVIEEQKTRQESSNRTLPQKKSISADTPLDGFELTKEDLNNFNASVTFAVLSPFRFLMAPIIGLQFCQVIANQMGESNPLPRIATTILSNFNPSYMVYPSIAGSVFTGVTAPNLLNPLGFAKGLWNISAPGRSINRIAATKRQLIRSWKGIGACYNNLGKESTLTVAKHFAVHSINAIGTVASHYVLANLAFQNMWYLSTALANHMSWPQTQELTRQMNETCPLAKDFSIWNLAGFTKGSPWSTLLSWENSPLWNFVPIVGFDEKWWPISGLDMTRLLDCGNPSKFPSLAEATTQVMSFLTDLFKK